MTSDQVTNEAGALDLVSEAVCALDADGRLIYVNVAAEHLLGRGREELLGRIFFDALPELAATMFYTDLHRALLEREAVEAEEYFAPLDRWLVSRMRPVDGGLHVCLRDVTDLRRAEAERDAAQEALRASEELHRAFISHSPDGIGRFEVSSPLPISAPDEEQIDALYADAELVECNQTLASLYGFESPEEAAGSRLGTFMPGTDPGHIEVLRQFIRAGYQLPNAELELASTKVMAHLAGQVEAGHLLRMWVTLRPPAG